MGRSVWYLLVVVRTWSSRGTLGSLPCGSHGELPQPRRMTTGAKASLPSTQCLRMLSRILGGKWMCRSQRKTMLLGSCRLGGLSPAHLPKVSSAPFLSPKPLTGPQTSTASTPACRPAERSKFPVRLKYWYLGKGRNHSNHEGRWTVSGQLTSWKRKDPRLPEVVVVVNIVTEVAEPHAGPAPHPCLRSQSPLR